MKEEGAANDLLDRIAADDAFGLTKEQVAVMMKPELYIGRSVAQVEQYLQHRIDPLLKANDAILGDTQELTV